MVPFCCRCAAVNVWPDSLEDGVVTVTVDYTLVRTDLTLSDVIVRIPLCVRLRSARCCHVVARS